MPYDETAIVTRCVTSFTVVSQSFVKLSGARTHSAQFSQTVRSQFSQYLTVSSVRILTVFSTSHRLAVSLSPLAPHYQSLYHCSPNVPAVTPDIMEPVVSNAKKVQTAECGTQTDRPLILMMPSNRRRTVRERTLLTDQYVPSVYRRLCVRDSVRSVSRSSYLEDRTADMFELEQYNGSLRADSDDGDSDDGGPDRRAAVTVNDFYQQVYGCPDTDSDDDSDDDSGCCLLKLFRDAFQ